MTDLTTARPPTRAFAGVPDPGVAPTPVRRRRPLLAVAAVLLLLVAGVVFTTTLQRASAEVLVWSLGTDVSRGETVVRGHLQAITVPSDAAASLATPTTVPLESLVGATWAADLPAGQLVSPALVLPAVTVPDGMAIVGVALERGDLPASSLRAGDRVVVIDTAQDAVERVLVERATVEAVALPVDEFQSDVVVSLLVPEELAAAVATAAARDSVALVAVP